MHFDLGQIFLQILIITIQYCQASRSTLRLLITCQKLKPINTRWAHRVNYYSQYINKNEKSQHYKQVNKQQHQFQNLSQLVSIIKQLYKQMSCHYSCGGCSGNVYYDLCTSCPSTRTLSANTCPCSSGYIEIKQQQCITSSQIGSLDSILINTSEVIFYLAIGLHFLSIILTLNRLISPSLKKIVDTFQVIGLISYYRFLQNQVATQGLRVLNTFNFGYLSRWICTYKGPQYGCDTFQNLFGPLFTLILFIILLFVSYFVACCMYAANTDDDNVVYVKNGKEEKEKYNNQLSFSAYWRSTKNSLILIYLDNTVIQTSIAVTQIAVINYFGVFVLIPFVILMVSAVKLHFSTINSPSQTTLAYRTKHSYFYLYDKFYHFDYIDHIFAQQNLSKDGKKVNKPFYPQSNLMIIEIVFKMLLGASAIAFYQFQPYLFAILCTILLCIYFLNMQNFFYYQRSTLLFYALATVSHLFALSTFFTSTFFTYFVSFLSIAGLLLLLIAVILIIHAWRSSREGQMVKKMYELQVTTNKVSNAQDSQDQLIKNKQQQMEIANDPLQNILFQNKEVKQSMGREELFPQESRLKKGSLPETRNNRTRSYGNEQPVGQSPPLLMAKVTKKDVDKQLSIRSNPMLRQAINSNAQQLSNKDIPIMTRFSKKNQISSNENIENPYMKTKFTSQSKDLMNNSKRFSANKFNKEVRQMPKINQELDQQPNQSLLKPREFQEKKLQTSQNVFQNIDEI